MILVDDLSQVPQARRAVAGRAATAGLPPEGVERLAVGVQEILANAILHGGGQALVATEVHGGRFTVAVTDRGAWAGGVPGARPDLRQLSGRGLWLAQELCDDFDIRHTADGTTVRLTMFLAPDGGRRPSSVA